MSMSFKSIKGWIIVVNYGFMLQEAGQLPVYIKGNRILELSSIQIFYLTIRDV